MANVSKVIYDGETILDLTGDTVDESSLLKGIKAHSKDGRAITGEMEFYEGETIRIGFTVASEVLDISVGGAYKYVQFAP